MNVLARSVVVFVAATVGAGVLAVGVGAPPERCPDITPGDVAASAESAAGWLIRNQHDDGTWLYEYDRATDVAFDDYNVVRHAGVTASLYQAAAFGIDGALESADRGLAWALGHVVERDDWAAVTTGSTLQAGTNALLVAALAERRSLTGDGRHDELIARLGRFLTSQVEPSGALLAYYDLGPDAPRPATYSIYYTGEAYWALGRLHRLDPAAGWGGYADRMGHYMATVRDEVEDIWPPLADHWSGYGLAETAAFPERPTGAPLTDAELDLVRRQSGLIGQRVRSISQRFGPWGVAVRGTFTPRGGGYGVFGEGLAGLWRAAELDARLAPERDAIGERATCIVGLAIEAQADAAAAARFSAPGRVEGAWFIGDVTRMDDQQHALSALIHTVPILEAPPLDSGHPAPSWWLWTIVVVGTLNPIRVARAVPGRDRRTRTTRAALGATLGIAALVAFGSTSGWLIDLVATSRPAVRLAAASLCLLTVAVDLVRRTDVDRPAAGGRWAFLVPVTIPLLLRPALIFAAPSVVADHSVALLTVVLLAGAVATVVGTAGRRRPVDESAVATWGARLLSAAALVGAVLLVVDAVFAV